jgi:hypothetical protein
MYRLQKNYFPDGSVNPQSTAVMIIPNITIPFDPANTDYANFKKEVLAGAELQDADGNVMTQEQADDFIKELP